MAEIEVAKSATVVAGDHHISFRQSFRKDKHAKSRED